MTLTDEQVERYSRQILLPEVGGRGQARLLGARVALAGSDEAAGVAATLLGRAGVGTLTSWRRPRSWASCHPTVASSATRGPRTP